MAAPETLHATCVSIAGRGVLLVGPPGAGKSDLALRLIDRGALLVADDGTIVAREGDTITATAPATIAGRMEIRGLGIVEPVTAPSAPVALCIVLGEEGERMPPDPLPTLPVAGLPVPVLALDGFETSAPLKVEWALRLFGLPA